jgi:hypothetical protein
MAETSGSSSSPTIVSQYSPPAYKSSPPSYRPSSERQSESIPMATRNPLERPGIQLPASARLATDDQIDGVAQDLEAGQAPQPVARANNAPSRANQYHSFPRANNRSNGNNMQSNKLRKIGILMSGGTWILLALASIGLAIVKGPEVTQDCPKSTEKKPLVRYSCRMGTWSLMAIFCICLTRMFLLSWKAMKMSPRWQNRPGQFILTVSEPIAICMFVVLAFGLLATFIGCTNGCAPPAA